MCRLVQWLSAEIAPVHKTLFDGKPMTELYFVATCKTEESLAELAELVRARVPIQQGDAVLQLDRTSLLITPSVAKYLSDEGTPESIQTVLEAAGATRVHALTEEQGMQWMYTRNPDSLTIERITPGTFAAGSKSAWHLFACKFPEAWSLVAQDYTNINWNTVRVGQIDTGYRTHEALGFSSGGASPFVDLNRDKNFSRKDMQFMSYDPDEALDPLRGSLFDGHGTRTGSVLAGKVILNQTATEVKGYFGGAPGVPYIPVRISDFVEINDEQFALASAINHLVDENCAVISLSMGFIRFWWGWNVVPDLLDAINGAYERGVIVVCAAGNYVQSVVAPARFSRTIAVGGSTIDQTPWIHSSCGTEVDVSAPSFPIFRATVNSRGVPSYGVGDGTSFGTALVAAAAALWVRHHQQQLDLLYGNGWQRVAAFKDLLINSAVAPVGWDIAKHGKGILNVENLLIEPLPPATSLREEDRATR
jgi:subtilisin family serine protease